MSEEPLVENEGVNAGSQDGPEPVRHGRHRAPGPNRDNRADAQGNDFTPAPDSARAGGHPEDAPAGMGRGDLDSDGPEGESEFLGAPAAHAGPAGESPTDSGQDAGSLD